MLETVLLHLNNFFEVRGAARYGVVRIVSGRIETDTDVALLDGQFYRISGSIFNDGLHKHGEAELKDEMFVGTVAPLAIPQAVISLAEEIKAWCALNPVTDKTSESFGGYSYTRGGGSSSSGGWQAAFAKRLAPWKKVSL